MGKKPTDWSDAEFEIIEPAQPKLKWWQGWYFDWRVFLVIAAVCFGQLIARLTGQLN